MGAHTSHKLRSAVHCELSEAVEGSWPLYEQARHFELGHVLNSAVTDAILPAETGALGIHHAGLWECNLTDNSLIWSGGVYDLFGLERGDVVTREQALSHYVEESRARLERLRGHALQHKCGFTIDVTIRAAAVGELRHVRLIGAPVYSGNVAVGVHGLKLAI